MAKARVKEKDYDKIAKEKITKPSKKQAKRRFLIYARKKKGKSTLAQTANELGGKHKVLMVDPEEGTDWMKIKDPDVWHVERWEDMDDVLGFIRKGNHDYTYVAIDGMTKINHMALRFIMKMEEDARIDRRPGIVDRRDYNKSGELVKDLMLRIDALNIGVIYTAQERMYTAGDDDDDELAEASTFYVPDLPQGVRGELNSLVDVIGRLYVVNVDFKNKKSGETVTKPQRRLWIGHHPSYDTGFRSEFELPDMVKNPTIPKLIKLIDEGSL